MSAEQSQFLNMVKMSRTGRVAVQNAQFHKNRIAESLVTSGLLTWEYDSLRGVTYYGISE